MAEGWHLEGNLFHKQDTEYLPLFEAKLFHQFNHRPSTFEGIPEADRFKMKAATNASSHQQLADPYYQTLPRFWVRRRDVDAACQAFSSARWFLAFRGMTNVMTNSRNAVFAVLPRTAVGNSAPVCISTATGLAFALLSDVNTFVFDYTTRQKLAGGNMNFFIVNQLPVLPPDGYPSPCWWSAGSIALRGWLLPRALELTYTAWDMEPFAQDCGWSGPPFRWGEERRFLLRCELDAAFFHLYLPADEHANWRSAERETAEDLARLKQSFPIPRDAVAYIMDTFPIVQRKDETQHGEYRTKRVILEMYNAMQEATRTRQPYQTCLDPPPGPPIDANGNFVHYAEIAANPPPHIHLPRDHANTVAELHLSDLARGFPNSPFIVRLGTQTNASRIRVTPVSTTDLRIGERVILAARVLRLHDEAIPAAIGKLGIESRSDASSDEHYVLVSVRGDAGVAQARLSEAEWKSLTSVGRIEDMG
jgi:hypothetical protein